VSVHDNGKESKPQELRLCPGKAYCDPDIRFSKFSLAVFHCALDCSATYTVTDLQYEAEQHSQIAFFSPPLLMEKTKFTLARGRVGARLIISN